MVYQPEVILARSPHPRKVIQRRTRVYVAGPYTGAEEVNTRDALRVATVLLERGYAPYVPHLSHYWDLVEPQDYETWMALCLEYVRACDVVLRLSGESKGADRETILAQTEGIGVYHSLDTLCAGVPPTRAL